MNRKKKKIMGIVVAAVLVLVLAAGVTVFVRVQSRNSRASAGEKRESTISLSKMDLTKSVSATGTIQSGVSKTVSANVNGGKLKRVNVEVGDEVKEGETLAVFDSDDLQTSLTEAKENLSDTEEDANRQVSSASSQLSDAKETYSSDKSKLAKQVREAKAELSEAKQELSECKKKASAEKNVEQKAKLEEQIEKANEAVKQAESSYEAAKNNQETTNRQNKKGIESAEEALESARSNQKKSVREAENQVSQAEDSLEECQVTAPISGIVTSTNVEEGDTYSGGELFQIDNMESYEASTTVDEYDISSVSKGQRVVILTEATGEDELEGEITFVAPTMGSSSLSTGGSQSDTGAGAASSSSSSGGYEVRISIATKDERLKPGMTARCSIILEEAEDVYAVPYDAVHEKADGSNVIYVSGAKGDSGGSGEGSEGSYEEITVTKGMESDYYVEISGDGLREGLSVIIPTDVTSEQDSDSSDSSERNLLEGGVPGGDFGGARGGSGDNPMKGGRGPGM